MRISKSPACEWLLLSVFIFLAAYATAPGSVSAQTINNSVQGANAVWGYNSTAAKEEVYGSLSAIDASVFAGSDICAQIANALGSANLAPGGVVDARGSLAVTSGTCVKSPSEIVTTQQVTILLPAGTIKLPHTWVLGNRTRLIGEGRNLTTIAPTSSFSTSLGNSLIQMGSSTLCSSAAPCTGVVISELWIQGSTSETVPADGVDNSYAGAFSYLEHVTITNFTGNGLLIQGAIAGSDLADGSGPYVDLIISNVSTGVSAATATTTCINLQAQTGGIHGLTCTANAVPTAGIYLDGSNNTIKDVHIEGVIAGILVGSHHAAVANIVESISGVDGSGNVTNDVEISNAQTGGVNNVSDLTLMGISPYGHIVNYVVLDQLTGISISKTDNVALYALGDGLGSGYTLFSTSPVTPSTTVPTNGLPTWGVGTTTLGTTDSCNIPGALYSNTSGSGSLATVFVCTESTGTLSWQPIA